SAAAAHAGAIAALLKSANPGFTQAQLRSVLLASAVDIEGAGLDRNSGAGIVMGQAAQPSCTFTLSGAGTVGAVASAPLVTVGASAPSCNWVAWSGASWISIVKAVGTGTGPVYAVVAANGGPARSGSITVEGGATITINQAAN